MGPIVVFPGALDLGYKGYMRWMAMMIGRLAHGTAQRMMGQGVLGTCGKVNVDIL